MVKNNKLNLANAWSDPKAVASQIVKPQPSRKLSVDDIDDVMRNGWTQETFNKLKQNG